MGEGLLSLAVEFLVPEMPVFPDEVYRDLLGVPLTPGNWLEDNYS